MAEIRPIRAWRYHPKYKEQLAELTSPLFDVVSEKQRQLLYQNELNSIHLSVPLGENPAVRASKTLEKWKKEGKILQDILPGIYVYYQHFTVPGSDRSFCRKGFICHVRIHDWSEKIILRHENTIPKAVNDRVDILEKTQLNASPTHGLYTDQSSELEMYMDESMLNPIYETEDYQGVRDVLSVIHDIYVIKKFVAVLEDRPIILADGHHRYEGSLIHQKKCREKNPNHTGNEGYNFHFIYLTNTENKGFRVLPTHRLIKNLDQLDEADILQKAENFFIIKALPDPYEINEIILGKKWAFGLIFRESSYKLRLKPEVWEQMEWEFPKEIKELDLTVLHYFFIEKILNIPGKIQRKSENIAFDRNFSECLAKVMKGEVQMALITNNILMDDIKKVCYSGYTFPQKSTYFYPKVICGFLFSSIKDDEFQFPHYSGF